MSKPSTTFAQLSREMIEQIALDYIVNEIAPTALLKKYSISRHCYTMILKKMDLNKKRKDYRALVMKESLERCAEHQANIIFNSTEILHKHVEQLAVKMRKDKKGIIDSKDIRDIISILAIIAKEYRLDHDKPTDLSVSKVEVGYLNNFTPITINRPEDISDAEYTPTKVKPPIEEIKVEIDSILENPLEQDS